MIDGAALETEGRLTRIVGQPLPAPAKSGDSPPSSCARRVDLSSSRCCFEFCKALLRVNRPSHRMRRQLYCWTTLAALVADRYRLDEREELWLQLNEPRPASGVAT